MCTRSNIMIKPLSNIESNNLSNISLENRNINPKNSKNDKIIPKSTNSSNQKKKILNEYSLFGKNNITKQNLNENMNDNTEEEKKK